MKGWSERSGAATTLPERREREGERGRKPRHRDPSNSPPHGVGPPSRHLNQTKKFSNGLKRNAVRGSAVRGSVGILLDENVVEKRTFVLFTVNVGLFYRPVVGGMLIDCWCYQCAPCRPGGWRNSSCLTASMDLLSLNIDYYCYFCDNSTIHTKGP